MINSFDIASYFIMRAYEDGIDAQLTNMKVQKLLYYAQSLNLALNDEALFEDELQAWKYGPVCPPVYRFYSLYKNQPLPRPDAEFLSRIPEETKQVLEEVWEYFGEYHAYKLSDMSHLEFPWKKARKGLPSEASSNEPILLEDLKALGEEKLDEIERNHPAYEPIMTILINSAFNTESLGSVKKGEVREWLKSLLD